MSAFIEYFRCLGRDDTLTTTGPLSASDGYFRFGDVVAYGQVAGAAPAPNAAGSLRNLRSSASTAGGRVRLPFDLSAVVENLRRERYTQNGDNWLQRSTASDAVRRVYYAVRPFMRVGIRRHLQKAHFKGWRKIAFPRWPVDLTVEELMDASMELTLVATGRDRIPFIWFWPEGATACGMMTHDVEGKAGLDFCGELMDIDAAHGIPSAFQLVPETHERAWADTARRLRSRGFEVNLHDLNHDGRLFADRRTFLERASRINRYARRFGCEGFRSGAMYREQDWFDAFDFAYDMSVPTTAHLESQRGGCCTVMPYFVGRILELPLTTTQDYTLFHILGDYSTALWEEQIRLIAARHGLVSIIVHPDYLTGTRERDVYLQLLRRLVELRDRQRTWMALPGDINRWWRNRREMTLVRDGSGWRVEGPDSARARVAYASLEDGRLVYTVESTGCRLDASTRPANIDVPRPAPRPRAAADRA
jgi:hypothetical protein